MAKKAKQFTRQTVPFKFIIARAAEDESTFAEVYAVCEPRVKDLTALRKLITECVTNWMMMTTAGAKAFAESKGTFNIGDLWMALPDDDLEAYLLAVGIVELSIDTVSEQHDAGDWRYDTCLCNLQKIRDFEASRAQTQKTVAGPAA